MMKNFQFGIILKKPSRNQIILMNNVCRKEGGNGFVWYTDPIGQSYGYFSAKCRGHIYNERRRERVLSKAKETKELKDLF